VSIEETISEYSAAWSQPDPTTRLDLLRRTVVGDAPYCDPGARCQGIEALSDVIAGVQEQFPGAVLVRTSEVDRHHDCIRFTWRFLDPAGATLLEGIDVCTVAEDGRIASFTVFFGDLVALA
jgi:hypothetical protein